MAVTGGFLCRATTLLCAYSHNSCSGTGVDLETQNSIEPICYPCGWCQDERQIVLPPPVHNSLSLQTPAHPNLGFPKGGGSLLLVIMLCSNHACFACHSQEVPAVISTQSNLCLMTKSNYSCKDGNPPFLPAGPIPGCSL